jgi:hypothetical protein
MKIPTLEQVLTIGQRLEIEYRTNYGYLVRKGDGNGSCGCALTGTFLALTGPQGLDELRSHLAPDLYVFMRQALVHRYGWTADATVLLEDGFEVAGALYGTAIENEENKRAWELGRALRTWVREQEEVFDEETHERLTPEDILPPV